MVATGPVARLVLTCVIGSEYGKISAERDPLGPNFRSIRPPRPRVSSSTILNPRPGRIGAGAAPVSATTQDTNRSAHDSVTSIRPRPPADACRAAFVISSLAIMPSRQHRPGASHTGSAVIGDIRTIDGEESE
jgi:hypothetical protein